MRSVHQLLFNDLRHRLETHFGLCACVLLLLGIGVAERFLMPFPSFCEGFRVFVGADQYQGQNQEYQDDSHPWHHPIWPVTHPVESGVDNQIVRELEFCRLSRIWLSNFALTES